MNPPGPGNTKAAGPRHVGLRVGGVLGQVTLALFWWLAVPFLFLTLYATTQLQSAAKEASTSSATVPNIAVIGHSEAIANLDMLTTALDDGLNNRIAALNREDAAYTTVKHRLRIQLIGINGDDPVDQGLLDCSSRDKTVGCFERVTVSARRRLRHTPEPQALELRNQLAEADKTFLEFLNLSSTTQNRQAQIERLQKRIAEVQAERKALVERSPPLTGVASTFDQLQKRMPWFRFFFVLPDGAVTGLFTGVMGALGAVVFSVYGRLRPSDQAESLANEGLFQSYVTRPLLGGLAGFMVYFAISAGSGALLEPGSAGRAQTGGALSTAALATMGLFAGLAAENALQWLAERARGLFKT